MTGDELPPDGAPVLNRFLHWKRSGQFGDLQTAHAHDLLAAYFAGAEAILRLLRELRDLPMRTGVASLAAARSEVEEFRLNHKVGAGKL